MKSPEEAWIVQCGKCGERFGADPKCTEATCPHCHEFVYKRYVPPGTYLYAYYTVDDEGQSHFGSPPAKELSPEEMKQVALGSLENDDGEEG